MQFKTKLKIGAVIGSVCLFPSFIFVASCSKSGTDELHIEYINDFHGAVLGYGDENFEEYSIPKNDPGILRLSKDINKIVDAHPNSFILSGGDENSGALFSTCTHGDTTYRALKSMGVRYAAVGNHAFEWGLDSIASGHYDSLARTDLTVGNYFVCSNILNTGLYNDKKWIYQPTQTGFNEDYQLWKNQRVSWADPYKLIDFNGHNIALIGLGTKKTLIDGNQTVVSNFSFIDYTASVNYSKKLIEDTIGKDEYEKIDAFLLLTHLDCDQDSEGTPSGDAVDLAKNIDTHIDAIFAAHSHKEFIQKIHNRINNEDIIVGQAGTAGHAFIDTTLIFDNTKKPGRRLQNVGMEMHHPSIAGSQTGSYQEAHDEWQALIDYPETKSDERVVKTFKALRIEVLELLRTKLGKSKSEPMDGDEILDFYDNQVKAAADRGLHVGHEYFMPDNVLDYFPAWLLRSIMLGYYHTYMDAVDLKQYPFPSLYFINQDSSYCELDRGDITLGDVYKMLPHDNTLRMGYLSIGQIGNLINYLLAGQPNEEGTEGFNYGKYTPYLPDLRYDFNLVQVSELTKERYEEILPSGEKITRIRNLVDSKYLCGPYYWYGMKIQIQEITPEEYQETVTAPDGTNSYKYDRTAKYRVSTHTYESSINGQKVTLPNIWLFDFDLASRSWEDIDNPDSWKYADYWYDLELDGHYLIPVMCSNFAYDGGNLQSRLIKCYMDFNAPAKFYNLPYGEKDFLKTFIEAADTIWHADKQDIWKLNINKDVVKQMVKIKE